MRRAFAEPVLGAERWVPAEPASALLLGSPPVWWASDVAMPVPVVALSPVPAVVAVARPRVMAMPGGAFVPERAAGTPRIGRGDGSVSLPLPGRGSLRPTNRCGRHVYSEIRARIGLAG